MQDYSIGNVCLSTPGLAIGSSGSPTVKYATTFTFKANGRVSPSVTGAAAPSLLTAVLVGPFVNGSATAVPTKTTLTTGYKRFYTLVGTLPINGTQTATPTFSWLVSPDVVIDDVPVVAHAPMPNQSNQTAIGYVGILNGTGSDFTPGTTALDTGNLVVTYVNNFGIAGTQ